jgi:hypothetical protein
MSDSLIDLLRKEAIPPERFIRNKLYRSLRDSGTSLVPVKYLYDQNVYGYGYRNTKYYVFENLITNDREYYKLEEPPALLTLEGARGPKFILPYEETLREIALRKLPQSKIYSINGTKFYSDIYGDTYTQEIMEAMKDRVRKEKEGAWGGRRKSKRRVRSKKYRTRRR